MNKVKNLKKTHVTKKKKLKLLQKISQDKECKM